MKEELTTKERSTILIPALISGAVGAGLALLLTPKSGREIRDVIGRLRKSTVEKEASEALERAKETYERAKAALNEAVATGQESVAEATEEVSERVEEQKSILLPVLIGGIAGAAIALLFAPKPGREMVGDIKGIAASAVEKGKSLYEQGITAAKEATERGRKTIAEEKKKLRPAA